MFNDYMKVSPTRSFGAKQQRAASGVLFVVAVDVEWNYFSYWIFSQQQH